MYWKSGPVIFTRFVLNYDFYFAPIRGSCFSCSLLHGCRLTREPEAQWKVLVVATFGVMGSIWGYGFDSCYQSRKKERIPADCAGQVVLDIVWTQVRPGLCGYMRTWTELNRNIPNQPCLNCTLPYLRVQYGQFELGWSRSDVYPKFWIFFILPSKWV